MVRMNGEESAGRVTRIHSDLHNGVDVLCLHIDIPMHEEDAWKCHESVHLQANWTQNFVCPSDHPWAEICRTRSVQGRFATEMQMPIEEGWVSVHLRSIGRVNALKLPLP